MQLKAIEPSHSALAHSGYTFKGFVSPDALVMAYSEHSRINKGDTSTFTSAAVVQEEHKGSRATLAQFYKPVVGDKSGIKVFKMNAGILNVKEFKIPEATAMEGDQYRDDFR